MKEKIKNALYFIAFPFVILLGIIYALLKRKDQLENDLANEKADRVLGSVKEKLYEATRRANESEADYRIRSDEFARAMAEFNKSGGDGVPPAS